MKINSWKVCIHTFSSDLFQTNLQTKEDLHNTIIFTKLHSKAMVLHDTYIHTNDRMREKTKEHTNIITIGRERSIITPWSRIDQLLNIIPTDNQMTVRK